MIQSMTGYGAATRESDNYQVTVELKSLNSKYLEATLKLPKPYMKYEQQVRSYLGKRLHRGKIVLLLNVEVRSAEKRTLNINRALVEKYVTELRQLAGELNINDEINLELLLELPEVIPTESDSEDPEEWGLIEEAMKAACEQLKQTRTEEGNALDQDLKDQLKGIQANLEEVKKLAPERIANVRSRIQQSLDDIRHKVEDLDKNRFEQELIYYLEKLDINEEIVRLQQHLTYFDELRGAEKSNGKQMHFLAQEMGREINTIGSKANDPKIQ
ncbi:MAG: YicC/YloC family endoribonuclease, partial [Bacteroidota bacterium]